MKDPVEFFGFIWPKKNYFRMPNNWTNITYDMTSLSEMKVVEYVLRHTWGFRELDRLRHISLDEFKNGRKTKDGRRLDRGTGLSKMSIIAGIKQAVEHGFLMVKTDDSDKGRVKKMYGLRMWGGVKKTNLGCIEPIPSVYRTCTPYIERHPGKTPLRGKPLSGGDKRRHARDGLLSGPFHRTAAGHLRAVLLDHDSDLTAPKPPKRAVSIDTLAGVIQRICVDRAASEDEVKAVIKWLKLAYADPYTPKMRKPDDLLTHWGKYRDAMRRWYADRDQPNPVDKVKRSPKTQVEHVVGRMMQERGLNPYTDDPPQAMVDEALAELGAAAGSVKAEDLWE